MKNLTLFDAADYLDNEEVITAYLVAAREDANPGVLSAALADAEKALAAAGINWETKNAKIYKNRFADRHVLFQKETPEYVAEVFRRVLGCASN